MEWVWPLIGTLSAVGYFIFRFGMISRGAKKDLIEFIGGVILAGSFLLMFFERGLVNVVILVLVFWFVITPIVELILERIYRKSQ